VSPEVSAVVFGLLSAASWGAGDFAGGLASKRSALLGVLVLGQAVGMTLVALTALATGEGAPAPGAVAWAMAAGTSGTVGLGALYRGLAVGRMAIVAPLSGVVAAAIPVAWGAVLEGTPPAAKLAGFALAIAGIWLVARAGGGGGASGVVLGLLAGCGFGGFLVLMDHAAEGGTFWPLAAARATTLALALGAALARGGAWTPARAALPVVLLSGALDAGGNAFFVLASQAGRLDVAAVLSSTYPATTVLLAAVLLGERVSRAQGVGIAAVLGAIVLVAG
jgi:drug/metabolite transporter (DMT)-like permease